MSDEPHTLKDVQRLLEIAITVLEKIQAREDTSPDAMMRDLLSDPVPPPVHLSSFSTDDLLDELGQRGEQWQKTATVRELTDALAARGMERTDLQQYGPQHEREVFVDPAEGPDETVYATAKVVDAMTGESRIERRGVDLGYGQRACFINGDIYTYSGDPPRRKDDPA